MKYKLDLSQPVHQLPGEPLVSECYEHITETSPSLSSTIDCELCAHLDKI